MKLYTEEEVKRAINLALDSPTHANLVIDHLSPIELPSDEEIDRRVKEVGAMGEYYKMGYRDAIIWYREHLKQITMAQQNMTAVEWLEKELKDRYPLMQSEPLFQQAKKMHKEQIMEGYMKAKLEHIDTLGLDVMKNKIINDTEKYYKETYGK